MLAFLYYPYLYKDSLCAVLCAIIEGIGILDIVIAVTSKNGTTSKEVTIADCSK